MTKWGWTLPVLLAVPCGVAGQAPVPALPVPITNNAVAIDADQLTPVLYSLLGVNNSKRWDGITNRAFALRIGAARWEELPPVPGPGRLAATAQVVHGRVYLFGGYTVDSTGGERSVPATDIYDPAARGWQQGTPMPVPVDDAVSVLYRDSLIYLVSGWHDTANVRLVQIYDPAADTWQEGTPIPGPGVFGHAGAISGNTMVFLGGAESHSDAPRYRIHRSAWRGDIDPSNPGRIAWRALSPPPGPPRYRAAGGTCRGRVLFVGGTDNPYNYSGIGYDAVPSAPISTTIGYDPEANRWVDAGPAPAPTMDHRGLLVAGRAGVIIGGMDSLRQVRADVMVWPLAACGER